MLWALISAKRDVSSPLMSLHDFGFGVILTNCFGVGVLCCNLYSSVVYLYVSGSGLITPVGEERANMSAVVYL